MSNDSDSAVDRIFNSREFRDRIRAELLAAEQRGAAERDLAWAEKRQRDPEENRTLLAERDAAQRTLALIRVWIDTQLNLLVGNETQHAIGQRHAFKMTLAALRELECASGEGKP